MYGNLFKLYNSQKQKFRSSVLQTISLALPFHASYNGKNVSFLSKPYQKLQQAVLQKAHQSAHKSL